MALDDVRPYPSEPRDLEKSEVTPYWKPVQTERPAGSTKRKGRHEASPRRKAEIRAKKCNECRTCGTTEGHIHAHHVVKRGAPWFGQWTENCIVGLCGDCHHELHTKNTERIRKILRVRLTVAEVEYADRRAYEGYVDDVLWRVRPVVTDGNAA